ncbi:bifunctional diguanylate cyclase/phosphodiesterase [Paenibacillus tyrfis]|uniref:bifunctional diguanylate cyclase/phosphodiesterase n=1 Tax=Paenibacillus tyrfis TaxID=1501230 RepID=UPI00209EB3BC|nr:bifunctional diguanylate cyclase/phosphodiesterase [Paenibacillus tyrfis]MCP1310187.1 EAL domain-containing protein [Paenibacillus tyrfis]
MKSANRGKLPVLDSLTMFFIISNLMLIFLADLSVDKVSGLLDALGYGTPDVPLLLRWGLFLLNSVVFYFILRRYNARLLREANRRRRSEKHLRLYARVFQAAQEGIVITDAKNRIMDVNQAFTRMTGYKASEIIKATPRILQSGKQDKTFYDDMWASIRQQGSWQGEIWNRRKDGGVFPEWLIINAVKDETGRIANYVGIFSDISERKKAEQTLRMHASVFESSHEGIMITNMEGTILAVNPAFTAVTGYTAKDSIGNKPSMLQSGRQDRAFYMRMWASIRETGGWQGEIWNKRKTGEIYPEWLTIKAVKDDEGNIRTYVGIFSDITERIQAEENLRYLAHYDMLTGLPNRRHFQNKLNAALLDAKQSGTMVGLLFIDLDRFKIINDSLGHEIGDRLLVQAGNRLCRCTREPQIVSRLGGDEFTVILPGLLDPKEVTDVADTVLKELARKFHVEPHDLYITGSIGISLYPRDGSDLETLVKHADSAMYAAKEQRNGYRLFAPHWTETLPRRLVLENGLRATALNGELEVFYQPQMDCRSGRLVGLEALTRWNHPVLGLISPQEFIPVAEEIGMIADMDEWVLENVCLQHVRWEEALGYPVKVAVNLSARQLHRPHLPERIRQILQRHEVDPSQLEIEITESVGLTKAEATIRLLKELRRIGVGTAIDDFGTGHSALAYLKKFDFSVLKIDKTFIRGLDHDPVNRALVQAIVGMAHALGLKTVAEGVETEAELARLKQIGCDTVQGYLLSQPLPACEMEEFMTSIRHRDKDAAEA